MRERTDRLDAAKATDAWTSELLGRVLARRVASLQDDPRTTLFFGRIDTRTEHGGGDLPHRAPARLATTAGTRSSSTGAPPSPPPSTGPPPPRRWASSCAAGSASTAAGSRPTRTSTSPRRRRDRAQRHPRRRDRAAPLRPDARHRRRRSSPSRTRSCVATSAPASACRAPRAPARPPSACTAPRGCSTPSARSSTASGVLVVGPNRAFLDHIGAVLPSLGEARVGHATIDTLLAHGRVRAEDATDGRDPQGRRADGRGAAPGRLGARRSRRRARWSCRAGRGAGGCPPTRSRTSSTPWSRAGCATPPPATCCPNVSPTTCCCRWSAPATPPTTACRTPWPGRRRWPPTSRALAGARPGAVLFRLSRMPRRSPPRRTAS